VITPAVELLMIHDRMVDEDASPNVALYSAATPATWGDAIDVPLIVLVAVLDEYQAEVMDEPGAYTWVQLPQFENDDFASLLVELMTLVTAEALDGE
jgi:hypothetical protein